jgi:hypothetical protein
MVKLREISEVIRSKNSGPYELTFDIFFKDWETFHKFCERKLIGPELVSRLYGIDADQVIRIVEFKPAKAIKVTIKRPIPSGALGETDVYGAQQHAPWLDLEFDLEEPPTSPDRTR